MQAGARTAAGPSCLVAEPPLLRRRASMPPCAAPPLLLLRASAPPLPARAKLTGYRCLLAPPACAKLADRCLPVRATAAPSGPVPPRVDLAGEEAGCSPENRLQYFKLVFPTFHSSNFNISYLQFQQFEVKC